MLHSEGADWPPILCLRATESAARQASWYFIGPTLLEQRNAWSMAIFEGVCAQSRLSPA